MFDFREHAKNGFFISSTPYIGNFDPVGEITVHVIPAQNADKVTSAVDGMPVIKYAEEEINYQELLDIIVDKAKSVEADALVNLNFSKEKGQRITEGKTTYIATVHILKGFAIKRR
jgi:hypothetical protein